MENAARSNRAAREELTGSSPVRPTKMATKQTVSKQSAKLPITGSIPVVASFHTCYFVASAKQMEEFMDLWPCWFLGASGETEDASSLNLDDESHEGSTPS